MKKPYKLNICRVDSAIHASVGTLCDLVGDLKKTVGQRLTREFRSQLPAPLIRRAVNDAAETAWATDFPHLFFPLLAEEKVRLTSQAIAEDNDKSPKFRSAA